MYIQRFVKGISGTKTSGPSWTEATYMLSSGDGIYSNWWRLKKEIRPPEVQNVLTMINLDRHLHDYASFGQQSPFISLASGCVSRDVLLARNESHSAIDTALDFATDAFAHEGYLFFGWIVVGLNPAVELSSVAESVRDLNVYRSWSPYQLEGEITAKIHIPANQIERVERWDPDSSVEKATDSYSNPTYVPPDPITNLRELF